MTIPERSQSSSTDHLSRRKLLATTGASILSTLPLSDTTLSAAQSQDSFIDAHVHVWTPDTKKYPLDSRYAKSSMRPKSFTPSQLMKVASASNVSRVVLIQMSFYGRDNSYMLKMINDHPGVFSGVAIIDPEHDLRDTMRRLKSAGVRGFRIVAGKQNPNHWLAGDSMRKMWSLAADEDLAICPLVNPEYLPSVEDMCDQFPKTRVVIDHFARIGIDGSIRPSDLNNLCRLANHDHVYVKTSAFYALGKKLAPYTDLGPMISKCRDAFGANRLMWASELSIPSARWTHLP